MAELAVLLCAENNALEAVGAITKHLSHRRRRDAVRIRAPLTDQVLERGDVDFAGASALLAIRARRGRFVRCLDPAQRNGRGQFLALRAPDGARRLPQIEMLNESAVVQLLDALAAGRTGDPDDRGGGGHWTPPTISRRGQPSADHTEANVSPSSPL